MSPVMLCEWISKGAELAAKAKGGVLISVTSPIATLTTTTRARLTRELQIRMRGPTRDSISKSPRDARSGGLLAHLEAAVDRYEG